MGAVGTAPTVDSGAIEIHAGQGIVGDRFYGHGPDFDGHVTFFSWELLQQLRNQRGEPDLSPSGLRRNVLIEGVPLNGLIGVEFSIAGIRFRGAKHCAPCRWMDVAYGPGTLHFLKGRGGLRAQALSSGRLRRGPATLITAKPLALGDATARIQRPKLPG